MSLDTSAEKTQRSRLLTLLGSWQYPDLLQSLSKRTEEWRLQDQHDRECWEREEGFDERCAQQFWADMVSAGEELREIGKLLEELHPELLHLYRPPPRPGDAIDPATWSDRIVCIRGQLLALAKQPTPPAPPVIAQAPAIVFLDKGKYQAGDSRPYSVHPAEDCVLQAFLKQPVMTSTELRDRTGYQDPTRALRQLRSKYKGAFASAIHLPAGKSKGGYHVRITRKPSLPS